MSQDMTPSTTGADKLERHHRQQLSALVDGALAPDEARFLLRRLQHDQELATCYERWHLCGQALRGQLHALAAPDLGARVAAAIRMEVALPVARTAGTRPGWVRWGGGAAALAASVAAVALFVSRPQAPVQTGPAPAVLAADSIPADAAPAAAATAQALAASDASRAVPEGDARLAATQDEPRAATRTPRPARPQAVVRESLPIAAMAPAPVRSVAVADAGPAGAAVAAASAMAPSTSVASQQARAPFASAPLDARPWPRAALPQQANGAYTASFGGESTAARTFYPFEPRLPAAVPAAEGVPPPAPHPAGDAPR
ncbi:hypothetical protein B1992_02350 [Pseudoxanthomonas broegbernensis]|uniref:Anti sigma-E protein RseA N-terminal domain-containing protein n=1 Tax=Pseudoxanthomonas broegbernensis TaxID=83619 RepID=A0A7V8K7R4_9GAMM|nr:RseA family anti-sigma factor [Pseudoxanthomonas broegbernensis]KAF1687527.1 hypothetical protein B1992_02350 [Pseudoxanthomonas broegbernensis]MBB6064535.1 negative regulator of sigma E activity [Pseudoxanthomonas broegbernensis]